MASLFKKYLYKIENNHEWLPLHRD
jgi:hypothetical protein